MTTIENVMETLFARRSRDLPPDAFAEIFDHLIWCLDDNGDEIAVVRGKWLEGEDKDKVAVALEMQDVFPCNSREEMDQLFHRITSRWPEFEPRCQEILTHWDEQYGDTNPQVNGRPGMPLATKDISETVSGGT